MASQRVAGVAGSGGAVVSDAMQTSTNQYPDVNHLMPASLRKVPTWYQATNFRHNTRLLMGVVPGLILLITVTGKIMIGAILIGMLFTLLVRHLNYGSLSMFVTVGHVIGLDLVNVYCMAPLIWRSILNFPLFTIFHLFITVSGLWWWLQEEEFRKQEPRFVIVRLLERVLFYIYPAISITMVTWVCGILFGRDSLPYVVLIAGVIAFSLYLVPLQSSFSKPNTPAGVAVIQHRVVVWVYTALYMSIPPLVYTAISYTSTMTSFLLLSLFIVSPPFLLSLLEAQGLDQWYGLSSKMIQLLRIVCGSSVMILVSSCVMIAQPTSFLPLLLLPILFVTVLLASFADHTQMTTPTLIMGGALAILYSVAFFQLPWSIIHTSSFLSLPLTVVQLLIWLLALAVVAMVTLWGRVTPYSCSIYNGAFLFLEYILLWDDVYPLYISMVTGMVAIYTFWRLHAIGRFPPSFALFNMCLHVTKLSLLYPCAHSPSPLTASLLPLCSAFLTSYLLLRLFLFNHTSLGSGRLLTYSCLLLVGLLLSVDTFVSPLWASLTHTFPTSPTLLAIVLGAVGLYMNYGLGLISSSSDTPLLLTSLPYVLGIKASLLWVLQPEFSLPHLIGSLMIIMGGGGNEAMLDSDLLYLTAWKTLLTWLLLFSTFFALIQFISPGVKIFTSTAASFLGVLVGFLSAISLLQSPPQTLMSIMYAAILGTSGALCGRIYSAHNQGKRINQILFSLLFVLFIISYVIEWTSLPRQYVPGRSVLDYYAKPCTIIIASSSLVMAGLLRLKMYWAGEKPYLPGMANTTCIIFFITAVVNKFHHQIEITILLSSLVFLLTQPDGYLRPHRSYIFMAPSFAGCVAALYVVSLSSILPRVSYTIAHASTIFTATLLSELACLILSSPGHFLFILYLWKGERSLVSSRTLLMFVMPNCFLPQLASILSSSILGSIGVFSFCLIVAGDRKLVDI